MPEDHRKARDYLAAKLGLPPLSKHGLSPDEMGQIEASRSAELRVRAVLTELAAYYHQKLKGNPEILRWLRSKYSISEATIDRLLIGYADNIGEKEGSRGVIGTLIAGSSCFSPGNLAASGAFRPTSQDGLEPFFDRRITFPYWSRGRVVFMIGRKTPWTPDEPWEKGKYKKLPVHDEKDRKFIAPCIDNSHLYNEDCLLSNPERLIITEGVTDCISLMEQGFPVISPVTVQFREADWERLVPRLRKVKAIYLCQDNEISQAGLNGALKTASVLTKSGVQTKLVILPLGDKQDKARSELRDRFGLAAAADSRDVAKGLDGRSQEEIREAEKLLAEAKIDVNDYFLSGHSAKDFEELLRKAQTPLAFAISRIPSDLPGDERNARIDPILHEIARLSPLEKDHHLKILQAHFGKSGLSLATLRDQVRAVDKKCQLRENQERNQKLSALSDQEPELPLIDALNLYLPEVTAEAWEALMKANTPPSLFRHATGLSRIEKKETGEPIIRTLDEDRLRYHLARAARWINPKTGSLVLPPIHVVKDLLASPNPPLPHLKRIVEFPFFTKEGILHAAPGFLEETGCYYHHDPHLDLPPLPPKPSHAEVEQALDIINELLQDFPFAGAAEKAHAVAMMLQPFVRELINGPTPLYLLEAPSPGTGKSLMVRAVCFPALGREIPSMSEGRDEEEYRKRITAALCFSPAFVFLDNVRRRIDSAALASAITSTVWEDRILGQTQIIRLTVSNGWIATGNNPELSSEIARRSIRIRLDAKTDRPWMRQDFSHPDIIGWVRGNRARLVFAILTLVQAWISEGVPKPTGAPTLGMFEDWSRVMGGILQVTGIPGFLENLTELYEISDREGDLKRAFVFAWWDAYGEQDVGVNEIYKMVTEKDIPVDLGRGSSERSQKTKMGIWLSRLRDNQIGQLRVIPGPARHGAKTWRLRAITSEGGNSKSSHAQKNEARVFDECMDLAELPEQEGFR